LAIILVWSSTCFFNAAFSSSLEAKDSWQSRNFFIASWSRVIVHATRSQFQQLTDKLKHMQRK
jgi:hypothetical protein